MLVGPRPCVNVSIYPMVSRVQPHGFWIPAIVFLSASGGMLVFCPVSGAFTKITFFFLQHFSLLARESSRILSPLFFQKGKCTYIFVIRKKKICFFWDSGRDLSSYAFLFLFAVKVWPRVGPIKPCLSDIVPRICYKSNFVCLQDLLSFLLIVIKLSSLP